MNKTEIEIMSMPVISTAHLSEAERLSPASEWPTYCLEGEYGFIAYFGSTGDLEDALEDEEKVAWPGFLAAAKWAERHGYQWIRFDCDGDRVDGLQEFEEATA